LDLIEKNNENDTLEKLKQEYVVNSAILDKKNTLLMWGCYYGKLSIVTWLYEKGQRDRYKFVGPVMDGLYAKEVAHARRKYPCCTYLKTKEQDEKAKRLAERDAVEKKVTDELEKLRIENKALNDEIETMKLELKNQQRFMVELLRPLYYEHIQCMRWYYHLKGEIALKKCKSGSFFLPFVPDFKPTEVPSEAIKSYIKYVREELPSNEVEEFNKLLFETERKINTFGKTAAELHLSEDDFRLVQYYSSDLFYKSLNKDMGKRSEDTQKLNFVYHLLRALRSFQVTIGTVYRGITVDVFGDTKFVEGNNVIWVTFTSCSKNIRTAQDFAGNNGTLFTINHQTGKDIELCSLIPGEQEILFLPNTVFNVVSVKKTSSVTEVALKEISGDDLLPLLQVKNPEN